VQVGDCPVVASIEAEHGDECLVDGPHVVCCQLSDTTSEPLRIDRTEVLDEYPCRFSCDHDAIDSISARSASSASRVAFITLTV